MTDTQTLRVAGMTCEHCVRAVTSEVASIDGVASVDVDLNPDGPSTVTVTTTEPVGTELIAAAIDEAGYELAAQDE
ncbi:MAG: cation transporter [Candidatus Nanopelagicales bacterium]